MRAIQSRVNRRAELRRVRSEIEGPAVGGMPQAAGALAFVASPGTLQAGSRLYAVGDIHGQAEKLLALHAAIAMDLQLRPAVSARLVYLGDYIDWGPDSAGVLAVLIGGGPGIPATYLIGDHEQMLLDALHGDGAAATDWLHSGGRETLASWGMAPDAPRDGWAARIPAAQLAFLRGLKLRYREGGYLFVHAGIRPGVKSAEQSRQDIQGIREPFLSTERHLGRVVVHGHTTVTAPVIRFNRIGIDTGAGLGGGLTAAVLEGDQIGFIRC